MLIEKTNLKKDILSDQVVLVTGAGGGIGYETARTLAYLGADVVIAEIDIAKGQRSQDTINSELGSHRVTFYATDITEEKQIDDLYAFVMNKYGKLDVLINNATIAITGAVDAVPIESWDKSYAVNLRAPIMLVQKFLPGMKERNNGVIIFVPSSGAVPYLGAYEVFKTAGSELSDTLSQELEGTGIYTFALAPGLVKTDTAKGAIEIISDKMNITTDEFYEMNDEHIISAEEAGAGFALSVVNAERYVGQEIGTVQVLMDAGIYGNKEIIPSLEKTSVDSEIILRHIRSLVVFFDEQYHGWLERSVFERQWILRDFKKTTGMSADSFHKFMQSLLDHAEKDSIAALTENKPWLEKLKNYYIRQKELLQNFEKDPDKLKEYNKILIDRIGEVKLIIDML